MNATGAGIRFFWLVCIAGLIVGSLGCMTNNWSSPLMADDASSRSKVTQDSPKEFRLFGNSVMEKELFGATRMGDNAEVE